MDMNIRQLSTLAASVVLAGCVANGAVRPDPELPKTAESELGVSFQIDNSYSSKPPSCIAVLPFELAAEIDEPSAPISPDAVIHVRRAVYAQLAPLAIRDVELMQIDSAVGKLPVMHRGDYARLGRALKCDAFIVGKVTEYGASFFGLYSRVTAGAALKMVRARDGKSLWTGNYVASSHGGSIPLSPVGFATGFVDAAMNMNDDQINRVVDELSRRLVATIPDTGTFVSDVPKIAETTETKRPPATNRVADRQLARVAKSIERGDHLTALNLLQKTLILDPDRAELHGMKARILLKFGDFKGAETANLRARLLDAGRDDFYADHGHILTLRGRPHQALASYALAIRQNPQNAAVYTRIGDILRRQGSIKAAADAYHLARVVHAQLGNFNAARAVRERLANLGQGSPHSNRKFMYLSNHNVLPAR